MFLHTFRLLFLRTRLLVTVAVLVVAANLLLPLLLDASPTPGADPLQLYLTYATGLTRLLLTLFALWASCAAIPQEAELHTLPLLLVRPLPRLRIWLGKWLAVVAASALLLLLAAASVALAGTHVVRRAAVPSSPLLPYAYTPVAPLPPDTAAAETALLARHRARSGLPPDAPLPPKILKNARELALSDAFTLAPSAPLSLRFPPLPAPLPDASTLLLAYRCDPAAPGAYLFHASATLDFPDAPGAPSVAATADAPSATPDVRPFPLPDAARTVPADASAPALTLSLLPPASADTPAIAFFFDPADGLRLRVPTSTFVRNALKLLLALLARVALLAAIGTTLGTLFSLPVAAFLSLALLVLLQCSATLNDAARVDRDTFLSSLASVTAASGHDHDHADAAPPADADADASASSSFLALSVYYAYRATTLLLHPFLADNTPDLFLSATQIPSPALLRALATDLLLVPLLLALLSALVLRRREWEPPA